LFPGNTDVDYIGIVLLASLVALGWLFSFTYGTDSNGGNKLKSLCSWEFPAVVLRIEWTGVVTFVEVGPACNLTISLARESDCCLG
jgi:hypothetical protein